MTIYDQPINRLDGAPADLGTHRGEVLLVVNVASKCGLTPQYTALEQLQQAYGDQGFSVLGFPCNQFYGQEPGTPEEIREFCSANYGITFPLFEKIEVNGEERHPLYAELVQHPDDEGYTGDIRWNFEKFLIGRNGEVVKRFSPKTTPDSPEVIAAIEQQVAAPRP